MGKTLGEEEGEGGRSLRVQGGVCRPSGYFTPNHTVYMLYGNVHNRL